jgi:2-dehydro-3-deoxy-D-arabinonate dehydratase
MQEIRLFKTSTGPVAQQGGDFFALDTEWDALFNDDDLHATLQRACENGHARSELAQGCEMPLAPISGQEVWASGVTYLRSRVARMEESENAGGGDFYDRVYDAERPELFFKATPDRVVGPGQAMHLRRDSHWIVPEPELVLAITRNGRIVGYTIGNDLSCRDIEGENPLYLPQAKTFDRCAALGPCILVSGQAPSPETGIHLLIRRGDETLSTDQTTLGQMKRSLLQLVEFLFRDNSHNNGCFLMTGTGIVPPDDITLQPGDVVEISIDGIGTLANSMN